jgi:NAD+ kinase
MIQTAGIIARYDKPQALKLATQLTNHLTNQNIKIYAEETLKPKTNLNATYTPLKNMKTDLLITIGGDGTILRTCIQTPKPEPPILAINMGVRGFLTEVEPQNAIPAIQNILNGNYHTEKHTKLAITTDEQTLPDALNDLVVTANDPAKILYTQIHKNNQPILKCQSDGLIIATQTGATAYSLSAGGPVIDPNLNAFVLTPICALTVFHSLAFPTESKITIKAIRPKEMLALIDGGHFRQQIKPDTSLTVTRSKNVTTFIRFKDDFYDRLKNRLLFKGMG